MEEEKSEEDITEVDNFKNLFTLESFKNDKSLLSVITFLVVAQFGAFSSVTITAPNVKVGLIIFFISILLSFVFIKQSYKNYKKGLTHIFIAFILGSILSIVLGHYWADIPFSVLFSLEVFKTESLIALISGMALSLFAGSKN